MDAHNIAILMSELQNGGPSPLIADKPAPMPILFGDEMEMIAGKVVTAVFGENALVTIVVTSYRRMLLLRPKRGKDLCYSFWHKIDFGNWKWEEPDGFVVSGVESTFPTFSDAATKMGPTATWQSFLTGPAGDKRQLIEVTVHLNQYHYHQQNRFASWNEMISLSSGHEYLAATLLGAKMATGEKTPGIVDLHALWQLHSEPLQTAQRSGGFIPEESPLHPSKATRKTGKITVSKISKGTRYSRKAKKAIKTAISTGTQIKGAVETAQKVRDVISTVGAPGQTSAALQGSGDPGIQLNIGLCAKCGAPIRANALFCGKCGHQLGEAIVNEIKDQVQGKVENKIIEKVEQTLESDDQKEQIKSDQGSNCPNCKAPVDHRWKFCPECAFPLILKCAQCGEEVQPDWKFCPYCTEKLANQQTGKEQ